MNFILEYIRFLRANKKMWMLPLVFILILIGGLLVLVQGSVLAPFIYTVF